MNKYDSLLIKAASEFSIKKGSNEQKDHWKTRIIYSVAGMMALASLWDTVDDGHVSIVHFKQRFCRVIEGYKAVYPEVTRLLPDDPYGLANEVYDICLRAGIIYHEPNRIAMSVMADVVCGRVRFTKGFPIDVLQMVSGIGTYTTEKDPSSNPEWFILPDREKLQEKWPRLISGCSWKPFQSDNGQTEFLRMDPPFYNGYWVNRADLTGRTSILRTGQRGSWLYYYYRVDKKIIEASQIATWLVENYEYQELASACLAFNGSLAPIRYSYDGSIVHVSFGYLLPPAERSLWKLYSWPDFSNNNSWDFSRVFAKDVFDALKEITEKRGFVFKEE